MIMQSTPPPILEIVRVSKHFPITRGLLRRVVGYIRAVDDVSFNIPRGHTVGLVGESGSGKTTLAHTIMRGHTPTSGQIRLHHPERGALDIGSVQGADLGEVRQQMQMIFQDPHSSLNPRMTVGEIIGEPLIVNRVLKGRAVEERVSELLNLVGLRAEHMRRFPHAFSGGQRQRIAIARALALNPSLIIADEPTSALDVSIQAQMLNLLKNLQTTFSLSYLFISHNLSVIHHVSSQVVVMYMGRVVEIAPTHRLFAQPQHPYTEALLASTSYAGLGIRRRRNLPAGELPNPANPPSGCHFHTRCRYARERCKQEAPLLRQVQPGHFSACHFSQELSLDGVVGDRQAAPVS